MIVYGSRVTPQALWFDAIVPLSLPLAGPPREREVTPGTLRNEVPQTLVNDYKWFVYTNHRISKHA